MSKYKEYATPAFMIANFKLKTRSEPTGSGHVDMDEIVRKAKLCCSNEKSTSRKSLKAYSRNDLKPSRDFRKLSDAVYSAYTVKVLKL